MASDTPFEVGRVVVAPREDGPKQQFFGGDVVLVLWDDGTVTWEEEE